MIVNAQVCAPSSNQPLVIQSMTEMSQPTYCIMAMTNYQKHFRNFQDVNSAHCYRHNKSTERIC